MGFLWSSSPPAPPLVFVLGFLVFFSTWVFQFIPPFCVLMFCFGLFCLCFVFSLCVFGGGPLPWVGFGFIFFSPLGFCGVGFLVFGFFSLHEYLFCECFVSPPPTRGKGRARALCGRAGIWRWQCRLLFASWTRCRCH